MHANLAKRIYEELAAAERWLIVPHEHPDGDALGAATALAGLAEKLGKPWKIFCATKIPDSLSFLHFSEHITADTSVWQTERWPLVIVVDSSDPVYAGISKHLAALPHKPKLAVIDHHATNTRYGDLNLVIPTASSTNEILYQFFLINRVAITDKMATSLLTGLITDTGTFTNAATSRLALKIGSELLRRGADFRQIRASVLTDKTLSALKLWGVILARLTLHPASQVVYTYVTLKDLERHNVKEEEAEGIANLLNSLNEGVAAMVLKERPDGTVKGSFRTTRDDTDVSLWAKKLGGGGHKKAAGFSVALPLPQAIKHIFRELEANSRQIEVIRPT